MKTIEERMIAIEATCARLDKAYAEAGAPGTAIKTALQGGLYFAIPMLMLWACGVDPTIAVRIAIFPYLLWLLGIAAVLGVSGLYYQGHADSLRAETANILATIERGKTS